MLDHVQHRKRLGRELTVSWSSARPDPTASTALPARPPPPALLGAGPTALLRRSLLRLRPAGWCRPRRSLRDGIDYSTPTGRMLAGILAALAAYERELMHGRAAAGREAARLRGRHTGRPPRLSPAQARQVRSLRAGGETIGELVAGLRRLPGHHLPRPERRRRARAACLDCSRRAVTMSRRPTPISRSRPATRSCSKQHHEPFEETGALIWFIGSRPEPRAPHWAGPDAASLHAA